MLPIDYHVQNALYNFNRDMKRLQHGSKGPPPARRRSKGGSDRERSGKVACLYRAVVNCLGQRRSAPDEPWRSDWAPAQLPSLSPPCLNEVPARRLSQESARPSEAEVAHGAAVQKDLPPANYG
jgi:hypothetical protein